VFLGVVPSVRFNASTSDFFVGIDLNLYYDVRHTQWYERPDWFLVMGVPSPVQQAELRWSYVMWQEGVSPLLVVELLSPGTEDEDLGRNLRELGKPPTKWEVYERILRVPFYVVFDRYENLMRVFTLERGRYQEVAIDPENPRFWFEDLGLGLGVWQGRYQGTEGKWLRWYDLQENWIPTPIEQVVSERLSKESAEQARESAEQARRSAIPRLRALGLTAEQISGALGFSIETVERSLES
jgi:Uma2 family endonuclease